MSTKAKSSSKPEGKNVDKASEVMTTDTPQTTSTNVRRKRVHQRTPFVLVTQKDGAPVSLPQWPVFMRKKAAQKVADKLNLKVKRARLTWD